MNYGKRSRLEIYRDILSVVAKGEGTPTRIMCRTNVSWRVLWEITDRFEKEGLLTIKRNGSRRVIELTSQGREILQNVSAILSWVKKVEGKGKWVVSV